MASIKRCRDFGTSFEQQLKARKPLEVNPFFKMMDAARSLQSHGSSSMTGAASQQIPGSALTQPQHSTISAHSPTEPCTCCSHCGCGLTELQVQQCYACKNMYCSSCSVPNYDAREDRVFCLDCHEHDVVTCCDCHHSDLGENCYSVQHVDMAFDRSPGSGRDICRPGSTSRTSLMKACSRAAAAASAAALSTTPFDCSSHQQHGLAAGSGFGYSDTPGQLAPVWSENGVTGVTGPSSTWNGSSWQGFGTGLGAGRSSSRGFGFSRENLLTGWEVTTSPAGLGGSGMGQLMATSPVIPFMGNESYYCMGTRTV